ncbi:efflux RND transporter periplasmic adaptor subunit [Rheinheimera riviphila]|uniref:Efflux RND transporter periplasmic adaptor subunit n=2 Tax=Rheinheimera riviphila TaxID=1834037 RepID=A0A437R5M5_9GAMM|nr:efflux RND transporter periplasmic adaptor subunit [Rheinheimera riviphila]
MVQAQEKSSAPPVPVQLAQVQVQDVPVWLRGLGQVKPQQSVEIRSQVDGLLQEILVQEGQLVTAGQLVARIDDRAINAALSQAKAELDVVQAQLDSAKRDLQRYQDLRQSQAISAQQKDQQQAQVQQLQAELRRVQATIHAQQVQLSFTQIISPISGQVGIRNVDAGNYVRPSDSQGLFSVVQLDPISVEMALPQARLPQLQLLMQQIRQQQPVVVQAYLQDGAELLATGKLTVVDNRVASGSGTIRVKADFANPDHRLWPAQSVVVAVNTEQLKQALTVPVKAVQQGPQGSFVWKVEQGKATVQPIQLLHSEGVLAVVTGVSAGQQVVVDGQSRLRPGATISAVTPAATGIVKANAELSKKGTAQ